MSEAETTVEKATETPAQAAPAPEATKAPPPPAVQPRPRPAPQHSLPKVSLDVYLRLSGLKPDEAAPFAHYAQSRKMVQRTIPEWKDAYGAFLARPVK